MAGQRFRLKPLPPMSLALNRARYLVILILVGGGAWLYGERMMYVALAVLLALPVISYLLAAVGIMNLRINQDLPTSILKEEYGQVVIEIENPIRIPFGNIKCQFYGDGYAVVMDDSLTTPVGTFKPIKHVIPFQVNFRGEYEMGLKSIQIMDLTGLFKLTRHTRKRVEIVALPRVAEMKNFPLANNLLTQAQSRFDKRDEDYSTISDIRQYLPTDSIKRVHWKLTAKRNEWLVKNFQSNALHQVELILDSKRLDLDYKELIALEDRMVELSLGLARFCLRRGMPVEYIVGEGHTTNGMTPADFDAIYNTAGQMHFEISPNLSPNSILSQLLNDANGYVNAIILTARLDAPLYERIVNAQNNGHYVAVLYFTPSQPDKDSEKIFRLLTEGNGNVYRVKNDDDSFE